MSSVAYIEDGKVVTDTTPTNQNQRNVGTDSLGKDAFMKLLVTQMQNQDPLNPSTDTEFISQLAQFSSLEQMENLNATMNNQSAFGLVGKNVIINVGASEGKITDTVAGYVQYVEIKDGKAYLAINDKTYSVDDLYTVIDDKYLESILGDQDKPEGGDDIEGGDKVEGGDDIEGGDKVEDGENTGNGEGTEDGDNVEGKN